MKIRTRILFIFAFVASSSIVLAAPIPESVKILPTLQRLKSIAFNRNDSLRDRWLAVTTAGRIYKRRAEPFLEQAMQRHEWFLRNAALVVVPFGQHKWAVQWSCKLLNDPALVVRTAAVEALRKLHAKIARPELWRKLYARENFRHGDSLWIRQYIVKALTAMATPKDEGQFIRLLSDRDSSLHPMAIAALQKLALLNFKTAAQWDSWWKRRSRQ